jgi:hypothetical protein
VPCRPSISSADTSCGGGRGGSGDNLAGSFQPVLVLNQLCVPFPTTLTPPYLDLLGDNCIVLVVGIKRLLGNAAGRHGPQGRRNRPPLPLPPLLLPGAAAGRLLR